MFISYPMLIIFNQTSILIKDVNITSTHPLWKEKCKKIKKNDNKSFGLGKFTQNGVTDIVISFKHTEGNSHEVIAAKDVCMKGMPKVKIFIKYSEDGKYIADYKLDFE